LVDLSEHEVRRVGHNVHGTSREDAPNVRHWLGLYS
jgi:hypothetical protein